jgi:hypothetical protein
LVRLTNTLECKKYIYDLTYHEEQVIHEYIKYENIYIRLYYTNIKLNNQLIKYESKDRFNC